MSAVRKIIVLLLCAFTFFAFYRPLEIEDNWWHLSAGRWMSEHHAVVHHDPFPPFQESKKWVLTQWLGSAMFYQVYALGGLTALKALRLLIFALVIGLYWRYARRRIPWMPLACIIFLMNYGLRSRVLLRPDIFNYLFIQLFLVLLFRHQETGRLKNLWWLLALGVVWGNMHLGSFVYGYVLIFIFLAANAVRWASLKLEKGGADEVTGRIKNLGLLSCLYPLTFFVSPYGFEAGTYPFQVFFVPDFIRIYQFVNVIAEAFPPTYVMSPAGFWVLILCLLTLAGLIANPKDRLLHTFLFIFPLFLFLRGGRASAFFAIAAVYVIARCAQQVRLNERWALFPYSAMIDKILAGVLVVSLLCQTMQGLTERIYTHGHFRPLMSVDVDPRLPQQAFDFLRANNIRGVIFLNDNLGGFTLWAAYPDLKPFVDGRQLHPDLFFKQVSALRQPQIYWPSVSSQFDLNIVLLDLSMPVYYSLARYLTQSSDWQMIFLKGEQVIFVKRGAFALNGDLDHFQQRLSQRVASDDDIKILEKMSAQTPPPRLSAMLQPSPRYSDLREEASTLVGLGFYAAGIDQLARAFEATHDAAIPAMAAATLRILSQNAGNTKL